MLAILHALPLFLLSDNLARAAIPVRPPARVRSNRNDRTRPVMPANVEADWVTTADYPQLAWREGRQGVTAVSLHVGVDGRVTQCEITGSSGHEDLDIAACTALEQRARFTPALDARGRPVASVYTKRVRWRLSDREEEDAPAPLGFDSLRGTITRMHFNQSRELLECTVEFVNAPRREEEVANICAGISSHMARGLPSDLPSEGVWLEVRDLVYVYTFSPSRPVSAENGALMVPGQ